MVKNLKAWFKGASTARREALAERAETTVNTLWQFGSGHRHSSAKVAEKIEQAALDLGEPLRRGDVCAVCARCPYYTAIRDQEDLL